MSEQLELEFEEENTNGLPRGWVWTTIKTVGEVKLGRQRSPKNHNGPHMRPYMRVANVFEDRLDFTDVKEMNFSPKEFEIYQLKYGDVLLNEGQSPHLVGRPAIWRNEIPGACFQNTLVRFRAYRGVVPEFALLVFRTQMHMLRYKRIAKITTNIAHLGAGRFAEVEFPLPPTSEQHRIVAELETQLTRLDAAVATLKRVQANLKRARASVLKAAVEGRLVPTEADLARAEGWSYEPASELLERILVERRRKHEEAQVGARRKKKYKEPVAPKIEGLPELPEGWVWASTDQLVQEGRPICYGVLKAGPHVDGGVPLVRVMDITAGDLSLDRLKKCAPDREAKFHRARLRAGDLVVSKDGTIGLVMVVPGWLEGGNVTQHVLRVSPNGAVLNRFLMHALHSPRASAWMRGETRGVALQGINVRDFRLLPVPVPPRAEQARIAEEAERRLSVIDAVRETVEHNLLRCKALRQSILKRAFEGNLVPQNPNDEPASELLARIQAEAHAV